MRGAVRLGTAFGRWIGFGLGVGLGLASPAQAQAPRAPSVVASAVPAAAPPAASATASASATATATSGPAALVGRWAGTLRLYEVKLDRALGRLPVLLQVADDGTLSGSVGAAQIPPCRPLPQRRVGRIDYQARLLAPLDMGPGGAKTHVVLLVTRVADGHLSADLHLKARFGLDLGMHPGSLEADRQP